MIELLLPSLGLLSPAGADPTRLTQSELPQSRPAWSTDGSLVAFVESSDAGDVVVLAGTADGLERMASGAGAAVVGRPMWLSDGTTVVWLRADGVLHLMSENGSQSRAPLHLSARPTGVFLDGGDVLVCSPRDIVDVPVAEPSAARRLLAAPLDLVFRSVSPGARPGELLIVTGPAVLRWTIDAGFQDLHLPTDPTDGYAQALSVPDSERVAALSRSATGRGGFVVVLDSHTGETARVDVEAPMTQLVSAPDGSLLAISGGKLLRIRPDGAAPEPLTDEGVRVHASDISPDGMRLVLALSGLEDTNGDGRRTVEDPPNLYLMDLPAR